ncbi:MAG: ATP-binding cassette domain-containing protein [Bacteroidaceae bacterium]|nr:ATP-binding cassette domain-containing protein [Bacteroidaceae bacterium]
MNMPVIKYSNVDISIDSKVILEDVSFTLNTGEFAYIIGPVGSGKSTLLKTLYGEVDIADGKAVVMDEYDMSRIGNRKLQKLRRNIGIVFQDFQLLTDRSIYDNLDFVLRCTGWKDKQQRKERIQEVLDLVGLPQKGYKRPHELSGGEQQRIVIARAILNRPTLLLADEPTGNLDYETGMHIMNLLHRISQEENMAVLMITHNEQWLKEYPGTTYRCKDMKMTLIEQNNNTI